MSEKIIIYGNELYHHGIEGQKWGVRRWQNEDGSLTPEGRIHYGYGPERERLNKLGTQLKNYKEDVKSNARFTKGRKEAKERYNQAAKDYKKSLKEYKKTDGYKNQRILMKQINEERAKLLNKERSDDAYRTKEAAANFERIANEKTSELLEDIFGYNYSDITISNKFAKQLEKTEMEINKKITDTLIDKYGADVISDYDDYLTNNGKKVTGAILGAGVGMMALPFLLSKV